MKKSDYKQLAEDLWNLVTVWGYGVGSEMQHCTHCGVAEIQDHRDDCPVPEMEERLQEMRLAFYDGG